MIKILYKIIFIIILCTMFTGCWDYKDLNRRTIALSVGIDSANDNIEFTGENADISKNRNKETTQITGGYHYYSLGKNFEATRNNYDIKIPMQDFSGALRVVIFGKKYAEKGIEAYINRVNYLPTLRKSLLVAVYDGTAKELFNSYVKNDISVGYAIEDTIKYLNENGLALYTTAQNIQSRTQFKDIGYFLPYITVKNNTIQYMGLAAMKNSKLVGIVNIKDITGVTFLLLDNPVLITAIPHPSNKNDLISTKTLLKKRTIHTAYDSGRVNINIDIKLNSQIQYNYFINPISKSDIKIIEDIISEEIKKSILKQITRSQMKFESDVFGFARYFRAENPRIFKKLNWTEEYKRAHINLHIETHILNTNLVDTNSKKPD